MVEHTIEVVSGALVARLRGSLDAYLADFTPEVERRLRAEPRHLVVNLSAVTFMGSRGMGLLFHLHKLLRDLGRVLVLAEPSRAVKDALSVGGIGSLLDARETEAAALEACPGCGSRTKPESRGTKSGRTRKSSRSGRRKA